MLLGLLLAGNLAGFGGTSAPVVPTVYYGDTRRRKELNLAPLFWERQDVQDVVAEAAAVKPTAKPRLAELRAELIALAETVALRDEARAQFAAHVAAEVRRRDDEAAVILILLTD